MNLLFKQDDLPPSLSTYGKYESTEAAQCVPPRDTIVWDLPEETLAYLGRTFDEQDLDGR